MVEAVTNAPAAPPAAMELDRPSLFDQVAAVRMSSKIKGAVHGITPSMLRQYLNRKAAVTADEMRAVTEDLAREILYQQFWKPLGGEINPDLAASVFDVAVRRESVDAAIKLIQTAIPQVQSAALKLDGRLGNQTLTAIQSLKNAGKEIALLERIDAARRTQKFRLFDGKLLGHDIDSATAFSIVMRIAVAAKTGKII